MGLAKEDYHYTEIKQSININTHDIGEIKRLEFLYTDALIAYCLAIDRGETKNTRLSSDEISGKYADGDNDFIVRHLANIASLATATAFLASLEPTTKNYTLLKNEMKKQIGAGNQQLAKQLATSVNLYRWMYHFRNAKAIVVNIAAATLQYCIKDSVVLDMKVVVGKPTSPTPQIATYCSHIVLYPYWYVPRDIGNNELLPKCKRNLESGSLQGMQLVGKTGEVLELTDIDWEEMTAKNFPYTFRQATGCGNALGVIKFELTDSLWIYLHDTNGKSAFQAQNRFLSHGCIRLQKPLELGNLLLNNKIDPAFVKDCLTDQEPTTQKIDKPIPVFIVYMPVQVLADSITYFDDVYGLYK